MLFPLIYSLSTQQCLFGCVCVDDDVCPRKVFVIILLIKLATLLQIEILFHFQRAKTGDQIVCDCG
jgi:hypothetical protein